MDFMAWPAMTEDDFLNACTGHDSCKILLPGSNKSGACPKGTEIGALPAGSFFNNNPDRAFPNSPKELSNMNRKELVDALAAKTESTKADAERAVAGLIDIISGTLKKGESLTLVGFGTFEVRKRAARTGRNPKTGEELKIKAAKVPAFKAGATLKAVVNGTKAKK
jgi:DNA-binding protein HU-beta